MTNEEKFSIFYDVEHFWLEDAIEDWEFLTGIVNYSGTNYSKEEVKSACKWALKELRKSGEITDEDMERFEELKNCFGDYDKAKIREVEKHK